MPTRLLAVTVARRLAQSAKQALLGVQDYVLLSWRALHAIVTPPRYPNEILAQMDSLGVGSLSIVVLTGMFTGMVPLLTIISDTLGIFGASLISIFQLKLSREYYWRSVSQALVINDLIMGLSKPVVFGILLSTVGCYMGLRTSGGTRGVGVSTTQSVVVGSVLILISDFFMTKVLLVVFPVT